MGKVVASPDQAIADIPDRATVALGGFGQKHCFATSPILALRARDVEVKLLTNKKTAQDEALDGLDWERKQVTAKDIGGAMIESGVRK